MYKKSFAHSKPDTKSFFFDGVWTWWSHTLRKLTLLDVIEFSIERWRSVSEQVIRNCWVKTGISDARSNSEFQSNNDYRLNSTPFQRKCAQLAELMGALGILASIDD